MSTTEGDAALRQRIAALEQALEENQRKVAEFSFEVMRMQATLEHSPVGVFQDDGASRCVYVNPAWCSIVGVRPEEAVGFGWLRTFHPEDIPRLQEEHARVRATNGQFASDYRIVRPNGEVRWVHGQSAPILSPTGALLGYLGTIHDITERVEARNALEKLRESLEQTVLERTQNLQEANDQLRIYGALFEHATDAILLATPEGIITHVNRAYEELLGAGKEVLGQTLADAIPWNDPALAREFGDPREVSQSRRDVSLRGKEGSLILAHLDTYAVREDNTDICGIAVMIHDLTAQKRVEAERLEFEAKIIAMQGEIIRELSTPLLPIGRGVIAMPLVGMISDQRAQQMIHTLLVGIQEHEAKTALVDITGVRQIDSEAAHALKSAARAARLLGTQVIISGMPSTVAQALVGQGIDMTEILTTSTLASAIEIALDKSRRMQRA